MNRTLLSFCVFYKGEDTCPFQGIEKAFWEDEQGWLIACQHDYKFAVEFDRYLAAGLASFCMTDAHPITLKAAIFGRYLNYSQSTTHAVESFKKDYIQFYS